MFDTSDIKEAILIAAEKLRASKSDIDEMDAIAELGKTIATHGAEISIMRKLVRLHRTNPMND